MEMATASVGLMIAPSATPAAKPMPGISQANSRPSKSELTTISTIDNPLIAVKSRRNSTVGIDTAAE